MNRSHACLAAVLLGCVPTATPSVRAGAPRSVETPEAPSPLVEADAPAPLSEPRTVTLVNGTPFGCLVLPNLDGRLLRVLPDASDQPSFDEAPRETILPHRFHRRLTPSVEGLRVVGPDGACAPALFAARGEYAIPGVTIVGQRFGRCGAQHGSFAFARCEVPGWLRYRRVDARIERLPARGALEDPMLQALEARAGFTIEATDDEGAAARRARLRRRVRRSTIRTEREELLVLELHHFLEGDDPCYAHELVTTSVHLRRVDGASPGPYEEVRPEGRVVGAYLDDEGRLVAFDTRRTTPASHRCAEDREGIGFECDQMVLSSREGAVLATYDYLYAYNSPRDGVSVLYWRRACDHTG